MLFLAPVYIWPTVFLACIKDITMILTPNVQDQNVATGQYATV